MFWLIIICLPRINDKPIVSQMRPWSAMQNKKWDHTYEKKLDEIIINKDHNHWFVQFLKLSWLDMQNHHYVLSVFLRDYRFVIIICQCFFLSVPHQKQN